MCVITIALFLLFFIADTATTEIYTLSLHDALPISDVRRLDNAALEWRWPGNDRSMRVAQNNPSAHADQLGRSDCSVRRSEEHTSELQSRRDLVCRLLLEKKKNLRMQCV